jgi:hypothetical protein
MRAIWVLAALPLLAGCKLLDQQTFAPTPEASTAATAPPKVDPRTALVTIGYTTPAPNYQDVLRFAIHEAERRAPGIQYDVVAMLPNGEDVATAQRRTTEVMRAIMAQNVPANRIHIALRSEPAGATPEVRVYVR